MYDVCIISWWSDDDDNNNNLYFFLFCIRNIDEYYYYNDDDNDNPKITTTMTKLMIKWWINEYALLYPSYYEYLSKFNSLGSNKNKFKFLY